MSAKLKTCPMPKEQVTDLYFLENRARLLDIAAFLDRLDRTVDAESPDDFRVAAFREAIRLLREGEAASRTEQIQMLLSDPRGKPLDRLEHKATFGAYDRRNSEEHS